MPGRSARSSDISRVAGSAILWGVRAAFLVAVAGLVLLSLLPPEDLPDPGILDWDKAQHALAYFGLCGLAFLALPQARALRIIGAVLLFGLALEAIQPVAGREASIADAAANLAGVLAASALLLATGLRAWFAAQVEEDRSHKTKDLR